MAYTYPTLTPILLNELKIDSTKTAETNNSKAMLDLHESYITSALSVATKFCQQPIIAATREMYFNDVAPSYQFSGIAGYRKIIPFTLTVASGLLYYKAQISDTAWTAVDNTTYRTALRDKNYYLEYWNVITGYEHKYTCSVGYLETAIPSDIQKIIIDMALWQKKQSKTGDGYLGIGNIGESGGVGTINTTLLDMPKVFFERLKPYRIETV